MTTERLNEQVKRNAERFPEDFLFRLGRPEVEALNQRHRDPLPAARLREGHDRAITAILSAIRELMNPPTPERRGIGFTADLEPTK